jgi:hypothetical protein
MPTPALTYCHFIFQAEPEIFEKGLLVDTHFLLQILLQIKKQL